MAEERGGSACAYHCWPTLPAQGTAVAAKSNSELPIDSVIFGRYIGHVKQYMVHMTLSQMMKGCGAH